MAFSNLECICWQDQVGINWEQIKRVDGTNIIFNNAVEDRIRLFEGDFLILLFLHKAKINQSTRPESAPAQLCDLITPSLDTNLWHSARLLDRWEPKAQVCKPWAWSWLSCVRRTGSNHLQFLLLNVISSMLVSECRSPTRVYNELECD